MAERPDQAEPAEGGAIKAATRIFDTISATWAGWFGAALTIIALTAFVFVMVYSPTDSLGFAALAGTAILSVSLIALIILSRAVGISEPMAALGLPHGSIRALLALGLTIVFVAVASWTLGGLFDPLGPLIAQMTIPSKDLESFKKWYPDSDYIISATQLTGVTKLLGGDAAANASPSGATAAAGSPDGTLGLKIYLKRKPQDPNLLDLAKQILTISATVLVTVVGFYFGSNSAAEAARTIKDAATTLQAGRGGDGDAAPGNKAPDAPITPDGLQKLNSAIAAIASATKAKLQSLGDDPLAPLRDAVASAGADSGIAAQLMSIQRAVGDLKKKAAACATDADRAKETAGAIKADADATQLKAANDRLEQLLADATQTNHEFDQRWTEYTDARNFILQRTAKG